MYPYVRGKRKKNENSLGKRNGHKTSLRKRGGGKPGRGGDSPKHVQKEAREVLLWKKTALNWRLSGKRLLGPVKTKKKEKKKKGNQKGDRQEPTLRGGGRKRPQHEWGENGSVHKRKRQINNFFGSGKSHTRKKFSEKELYQNLKKATGTDHEKRKKKGCWVCKK